MTMNMQPVYFEKQKLCITSSKDVAAHVGSSSGNHAFRMRSGDGKWISVKMRDCTLVASWVIGTTHYFAWHIK
jgi:hypothetical protein